MGSLDVRLTAVILGTVDEQLAADPRHADDVIDPGMVRLPESEEMLVFPDFRHDAPPAGLATNLRLVDGRIVADVDVLDTYATLFDPEHRRPGPRGRFAVGVVFRAMVDGGPPRGACDLIEIGAVGGPRS